MRTAEEINKEIKSREGRIWFIRMADRSEFNDYQIIYHLEQEIKELEEELKCLRENSTAPSAEASV